MTKKSIFFPPYANKKTLEFMLGREDQAMALPLPLPLPKDVVMSIAQFVIDQELSIGGRDGLSGEKLMTDYRHYVEDLCDKAKSLKELSASMDYHEGIKFRNEFAREFIRFRDQSFDLLSFLSADIYSTREVSIEFRRAFIGFRVEFSAALPDLIDKMDLIDMEYSIRRRTLYPERALFY